MYIRITYLLHGLNIPQYQRAFVYFFQVLIEKSKVRKFSCTDTIRFNSFLASRDFHHLLLILANSLDPDQARQYVGPDLDPICLII